MSYPKVYGAFRLVKDPEFVTTAKGTEIANLTLVANPKNRESGYPPLFIQGAAFGGTTKMIEKLELSKGDMIYVEADLTSQYYYNKDNKKTTLIKLFIHTIYPAQVKTSFNPTMISQTLPDESAAPPIDENQITNSDVVDLLEYNATEEDVPF